MRPDPVTYEILGKLADSLCKHQKVIVEEWLQRVVADEKIPASDRLTKRQIEDHVPALLEELAELIAGHATVRAEETASTVAKIHGSCRWEQGFELPELLRELSQLRAVIVRHIFAFELNEPTFSAEARAVAFDQLHLLLDELNSCSVKQFVGDQEARLRQHAREVGDESEARLRLLRTVSHEVRNVLNAVNMAAQSVPEETDETVRDQMVEIVLRNVRYMRELLDQLLDVSALIAEKKTSPAVRFNPAALVQEIVATYQPSAQAKALALQGVIDPRLTFVESDELKIRQVACNLLSNAIKYTEHGWIRLEFRALDDAYFVIMVEDSGAGMTQEEADQVFSEFYRVKRTAHQPGIGLGLAITKQLVKTLGGRIEVRSQLGRGSCFEVVLPRMRRDEFIEGGQGAPDA